MTRYKSIQSLLKYSHKQCKQIESLYNISLTKKIIDSELQPLIKNYLENLKSCLDYCAHDIYEKITQNGNSTKLYFPIKSTRAEFETIIKKDFTSLNLVSAKIFDILEEVQPYNKGGQWLEEFNKLTNDNKHQDLTPQIKKEIPQKLSISHRGATITMGRASSLKIRRGGTVKLGGARIADDQIISVDSTEVRGDPGITLKKEVWVGFVFFHLDKPVIPLLSEIEVGVRNILDSVYKELN